jgi:putative hemolysin
VSDALRILAVLALVAGNAFFVMAEYAIVTARRGALAARAETGSSGARIAGALMDEPVRVISTVQVGISAIGILTGALGEPVIRDLLGEGVPRWLAFVIAFSAMTYLSVVLGELVPKAVTLQRAEGVAAGLARPIWWLSRLFRPVVWVLERSATLLLRPLGIREVIAGESISSPEDLRMLVDEAETSGVIPRAQEELLHNVFDFAGREAQDVMVPAHEVAWLDAGLGLEEALDRVLDAPHARYLLCDGALDRLRGIVHARDLLAAVRRSPGRTLPELARPAMVVPGTKDLGALLREFRESREHLAVIVDEYGGVDGIVSLEDVVEELVGEIEDEFDLPDARMEWLDDRRVRVAGSLTIDDFNETVGTRFPQEGPRTLAGLVLDGLGRRPEPGDVVEVDGARIEVEALDGLRIAQLGVTLPTARATPT